jgi:hypothetical protein
MRRRGRKPLLLEGILNLDDVRRLLDAGVDGIVLGARSVEELGPEFMVPASRSCTFGKLTG